MLYYIQPFMNSTRQFFSYLSNSSPVVIAFSDWLNAHIVGKDSGDVLVGYHEKPIVKYEHMMREKQLILTYTDVVSLEEDRKAVIFHEFDQVIYKVRYF